MTDDKSSSLTHPLFPNFALSHDYSIPSLPPLLEFRDAIDILQRAAEIQDFKMVARGVKKTNALRRRLSIAFLKPVLNEVAPSLLPKLDEVSPFITKTQIEEEEEQEAKAEQDRKDQERKEAEERARLIAEAEKKEAESKPAKLARASSTRAAQVAAAAGVPLTKVPSTTSTTTTSISSITGVAGAPVGMSDTDPLASTSAASSSSSSTSGPAPLFPRRKPDQWYPEIPSYLQLLITYLAFDRYTLAQAVANKESSTAMSDFPSSSSSSSSKTNAGNELLLIARNQIDDLVDSLWKQDRRQSDTITGIALMLQALIYEHCNMLTELRAKYITQYATACRQHNQPAQAAIIVTVLRSFILSGLYAQADKFRLHATFPPDYKVDVGLHARYLYYCARVFAMQLQYSSAADAVLQALRKAPSPQPAKTPATSTSSTTTSSSSSNKSSSSSSSSSSSPSSPSSSTYPSRTIKPAAVGFVQAATKLHIVVQLLLGETPDRSTFFSPQLRTALLPYLRLAQAVRIGTVGAFNSVIDGAETRAIFEKDGLLSLVTRLRQNVIRTGLRRLTAAYSRLTIRDIAERLQLPFTTQADVADAEMIVAKAVGDGVVDAVIDTEHGVLTARRSGELFASSIPQRQLVTRIAYCLDVHSQAMQLLRYPDITAEDEEGVQAKTEKAKKDKEKGKKSDDKKKDDDKKKQ